MLVRVGNEEERGIEQTYTCTSFIMTLALGVLGANRSEHAIRAATTKATVVKKVKTFWARLMVEFIVARFWGLGILFEDPVLS